MMRKRTVGALREKGIGVGVFTIDSLRAFEQSRKVGLDFVITNEPGAMIRFRSRNL
jgi:glycerophosphoryl diester phosphodiesterase